MPEKQQRQFLLKRDILIMAVLLALALAFFAGNRLLASSGVATAEIFVDSELVRSIELRPGVRETFPVPGRPEVVLEVEDGKIRFLSSTCRDKICVNAGFLSRPGEMAACLPNRVAVKITGGGERENVPDTYVG